MASQKTIELQRNKLMMRMNQFRVVSSYPPGKNRTGRRNEIKRWATEHRVRFQDVMAYIRKNGPSKLPA